MTRLAESRAVSIPVGRKSINGDLSLPPGARGVVVFAHGSGSSRRSASNQYIAEYLNYRYLGTLLIDLLTFDEEAVDMMTSHLRFDIELLSERLITATDWVLLHESTSNLPLGYFAVSTGAAAALVAAAKLPDVETVVCRGGRPDLAEDWLARVHTPTLLIVGQRDDVVLRLNREAAARIPAPVCIEVIPGATHLFEEKGALERVAALSHRWFNEQFKQFAYREAA